MSSEEEFDWKAWFKKLMDCKTSEEMTAVFEEHPLTEEQIRRSSSMAPEDLEYYCMELRRE